MAGLMAALVRPEQSEAGPSETKRKKIPKVAVYVSGAAFAITTGLTLLILPYARQAARMNRIPTEFRSNRHLLTARPKPSSQTPETNRTSREGVEAEAAVETDQPLGEPMGGLLAFQAFGIATAIVFGSAGLGAWGTAKLLGVNDMEGFSGKMREKLEIAMPGLTSGVRKYGAEPDELGDFLDDMGRDPVEGELERPREPPS